MAPNDDGRGVAEVTPFSPRGQPVLPLGGLIQFCRSVASLASAARWSTSVFARDLTTHHRTGAEAPILQENKTQRRRPLHEPVQGGGSGEPRGGKS